MKVKILNESSRHGQLLCHWTNLNGLIGILQDNILYGNPEFESFLRGKVTVSLTRTGTGKTLKIPAFISEDTHLPLWTRIVIDADKLNNDYKISPFEFHQKSRGKQDSQAEEAVIVGKGKVIISVPVVGGTVFFNDDFNDIDKVTDNNGNIVEPDEEGYYQLDDRVKFDLSYSDKGYVYDITIYDEDDEYLDSIEYDSFEIRSSSENKKSGIKNIKKYIKYIEIPDILLKLLDNNRNKIYFKEKPKIELNDVVNKFLESKKASGLHGDNFKRIVQHSISNFKEFYKFLQNSIGTSKIKTYKIPTDWY